MRPRRSSRRTPWGAIALIIAAGVATYWNALETPFLWDDFPAIVQNETIRGWTPAWAPFLPPHETPVSRRPIVNASFAANYAFGGYDVVGYHRWNLGIHLLTALLLFAIVRPMLGTLIALGVTLWWMLHPLVSEVVTYTTQRSESMVGLLLLTTLYCAMRALDSPHPRRWHAAAIAAYACGIGTKESIAVAPLIVILYDRIFVFATVRDALAARRALYAAFAAGWVALALLIWLEPHSTIGYSGNVDAWTYAMNQARVIPRYLRLAIWPDALVVDYGLPHPIALADAAAGGLLILTLLAATAVALWRSPRAGFLGAVFFLTLAPSSSIIPIVTEAGAERRMYLPLAAIAVMLGALAAWAIQRSRRAIAIVVMFVAIWPAALAVRTVYRNREFATPVSIWRTSVARYPHGRARMSYAMALIEAGNRAEAIPQLWEAVLDYPDARFALATELATDGSNDEAARLLTGFIAAQPDNPNRIPAHVLLGQVRARQGRIADAQQEFDYVLQRSATNMVARLSLADLLLRQRRFEEAASQYRVLADTNAADADTLVKFGGALASSGKPNDAAAVFERALRIDPGSIAAHLSLAELLLASGRAGEAGAHARAALERDHGNALAYNLLGIALAEEGQFDDAAAQFRNSLRLAPNYSQARNNLARAEQEAELRARMPRGRK